MINTYDMQKTLKLRADVNNIPFQREYSAIFRFTYERWIGKFTEKQIRSEVKARWPDINCWIAQCAIKDAKTQYTAHSASKQRPDKVIWGTKKLFDKRQRGEITNAEFKKARLRPVIIQGEALNKSNRLFDFSKLYENILIFKPNKHTRIEYNFYSSKNQNEEIQNLINNIGIMPIQVLLKDGWICFSYEQEKSPSITIKDRILGIDMNPSNVGSTIIDFKNNQETLIKSNIYKISKETRTNDNKRNHETIQLAHAIIKLARHYRCSEIALEKLTMGSSNAGLGRNFNRLCNNEWNRELFQWNIRKLCDKYGIICKEVNCAYSSTIGNILHRNLPDSCAAAWEIARRSKYQYVKELCMYPLINFSKIGILNHWKKDDIDLTRCINWRDLHNKLKSSGLKYRVELCKLLCSYLDFCCKQSGITILSNFSIP